MATKTRKSPVRKMKKTDADAFTRATDCPDGWTARALEYGDSPYPNAGEVYSKPKQKGDAWCWHRLAVGVLHNEAEDIWLIVNYTERAGFGGTDGKAGWKVVHVYRSLDDGKEITHTDHIAKGGWYEKFQSATDIKKRLPKRFTHQRARYPIKKTVKVADLVSIEVTPIKAAKVSFSGTTRYRDGNGEGYRTFDRIGVEESFYGSDQEHPNLCSLIEQEMGCVATARARQNRSTSIPSGFGWSVTPEGREEISKKLQAGGSHTFSPSGFGTAKVLSAKSRRGYTKASAAIAKFFGVKNLYQDAYGMD